MSNTFRKAETKDGPAIWKILEGAIARRAAEGSKQWQNGYPNPDVVSADISKGVGFVLEDKDGIIGYCAALINDEPAYANITGAWLTQSDFIVVHRVAIAEEKLGKNLSAALMEHVAQYAVSQGIFSIKVDTNFDNMAMMRIFEKAGYSYCGEVYLSGGVRRAYEKILTI